MKKLNTKEQKGAVTILVLVTVLSSLAFLTSMYMLVARDVQTQMAMTEEIKRIYEAESAEEVYNNILRYNLGSIYSEE